MGDQKLINHSGISGQLKRLKGAIWSGKAAACLGMLIIAMGPFTRFIDKVIGDFYQAGNDFKDDLPPCVMLVSSPRSGGTVIYQALVRAIPCTYISNLHVLFPRLASGHLLRRGMLGAGLGGFNNYYGYTSALNDVNEGNMLVEGFFKNRADKELIRKRFLNFIRMLKAKADRPLIFKNVRAYTNISRFHEAVPEVVFVRIKRDPEQIIQSTLRAYYDLGTFHPIPKALISSGITDPVEFAVRQLIEIEHEIDKQKKKIDPSVWLEWSYESFCSKHRPLIEDLTKNYLKMDLSLLRRDSLPKSLVASKRKKVSKSDANKITLLYNQFSRRD